MAPWQGVGDVAGAHYSSKTFAAITNDGASVYDSWLTMAMTIHDIYGCIYSYFTYVEYIAQNGLRCNGPYIMYIPASRWLFYMFVVVYACVGSGMIEMCIL